MGIHNFKAFLNTALCKSNELEEFDSIFVDIQSYLYKAIQFSFVSTETELMDDICTKVVKDLCELFENIFSSNCFKDTVKVIISFDGESLPMKHPTQKQRRSVQVNGKDIYKVVLFGHNTISNQVCDSIIDVLTNHTAKIFPNYMRLPSKLDFTILGSNTKGEGEHKLFSMGSFLKCRKPVIASVDNDVFIIALSQLSKFDSIQIYKQKKDILNVHKITSKCFTFEKEFCILASLLFGNDFIPAIINLTEKNCPLIHEALRECNKKYMPHVFYTILNKLKKSSKIRYKIPPQIEEIIVIEFWKNCFWVLDYYEKYNFSQKFMENNLFDIFEKNHVIVALLDKEFSEESYKKAYFMYKDLNFKTYNINPKNVVFTTEQLDQYKRFFPTTNNVPETYHSIFITYS